MGKKFHGQFFVKTVFYVFRGVIWRKKFGSFSQIDGEKSRHLGARIWAKIVKNDGKGRFRNEKIEK